MKKILSITVLIALLASCGGGYNPPVNPGSNGSGSGSGNNSGSSSGTNVIQPTANFSFKTYHPFIVSFQNTSQNAVSYKWDFGDGVTSTDENPVHQYNGKGVYKITLTASKNGKSDKYSCNVTLVDPTKCYVTEVEYISIPKNNEYYNIRCTDDYLFFESLYWKTNWIMLSSANLPYKYRLEPKQKVDFSLNCFVIRLQTNSTASGKGSEVSAWKIDTKEVKNEFPIGYTLSDKDCVISIKFTWED